MKFRYRRIPDDTNPNGYSLDPLLEVRLANGSKAVDIRCLIDSGAGDCLFHRSIGELLGLEIQTGNPKIYYGIAGQSVTGYIHEIGLRVQGFSEWVTIEAGFIEPNLVPLLGQSGFFENYQITFERYRGRFELKSRSFLHRA